MLALYVLASLPRKRRMPNGMYGVLRRGKIFILLYDKLILQNESNLIKLFIA